MSAAAYAPTPAEQEEFDKRLHLATVNEDKVPANRVDGQDVIWAPQNGSQVSFMSCTLFECLFHGTRGPGKSLENHTPVLTDQGWVPAGEITYEHRLVTSDGSYTKIAGIFPNKDSEMRRVTFTDGSHVIVCKDHRWLGLNSKTGYREGWKVRTTDKMMGTKGNFSIPFMQGPWEGLHKWEGPDPYMVGLLLGDGTMRSSCVTLYSADEEIMQHAASLGWHRYQYGDQCMRAACPRDVEAQWRDIMPRVLAKDKSVPKDLMNADPAARLAVLQGLLDSDGSCETNGKQSFCSNSEQLARDVVELAKGLGGWGSARYEERPLTGVSVGARGENGNRWRVSLRHNNKFIPFRLTRKVERLVEQKKFLTRGIKSIEPCGIADAVCFAVEHHSHLFVCGDWVMTHNTDALLMSFAQHVGKGYGAAWTGVIFRQTYPQLADVQAKSEKWFRQIFPGAKFNIANMTWTWPTGERLLLRHMNRPSDYWNYHGHEYPFIGWEELTNWPDDQCFKSMFACCRTSTPGVPRMVRATTNPYGPGHSWVKERYRLYGKWWHTLIIADATDREGNPEPIRCAIHGHIDENLILLAADPLYKQTIIAAAANPAMAKAWLNGSWDIVAGGMFEDVWDPEHNIVGRFVVPHSWKLDRSFDWGSSAPFSVGWWTESDGTDLQFMDGRYISTVRGDLFRVREWYGWNGEPNKGLRMLAVDIAKGIVERELLWGWRDQNPTVPSRVKPGPADTSIFNVENGMSIGTDMGKPVRIGNMMHKGTFWSHADKRPGSRKIGWEAIRKVMKAAHPQEGRPREKPGLFVVGEECPQFLRTVLSLPRSEKDLDDVNTKAEDHCGDEVRYRVRASGGGTGSGAHTGMS